VRNNGNGVLLMIALNVLPLLLLGLAWWLYRNEGKSLVRGRKVAFVVALIANAVSAVVLLSFTVQAYVGSRGQRPVDLDRIYPVMSMLAIGALAAVLAICGRRASRLVLISDGILTAVLWYLAGLAVSP